MKKIYRKFCLLISLLSCITVTVMGQSRLSIGDAIARAVTKNTTVVKTANSLAVTKEAIKVANAALLPTVSATGSYSYQASGGEGTGAGDGSRWSAGLGGSVTLFDGLSTFANIRQKENSYSSAVYDLEKLKQDATLQTINLYLAFISDKKLLDFQKEDLSYNKALLEKIRQMYAIKSVAVTDVYSQEAQTANSELSYISAENNYEKAKVALLNYLSLDVTTDYTFSLEKSEVPDTLLNSVAFGDLFDAALANRQDLKSSAFKVKTAEEQVNSAKGGDLPRLTGTYNLSTDALNAGDLLKQRYLNLGLNLSYPIFSQYSVESAVQSAQIQLQNTQEDMAALSRQVKTDVKNSSLDLQTAAKQFQVAKKALASAEQSWKAKKETYTLGAAPYLDLQLAYNNYLQAEYTVISKEYSYIGAQFALENAIGKLQK